MTSKKKKLSCFIIALILSLSVVAAAASALTEEQVLVQQEEENDDMIISGREEDDDDTTSHEEEQHFSSSSIIIDTTAAAAAAAQKENNVKELPPITVDSATASAAAHEPPSHFQISAHIQTNLHTGLSYFLPLHDDNNNNQSSSSSSFAHIPFLECGAIGSTTATVPLVSGVFRHSPVMVVMSDTNNISEKEKLLKRRGGLEFLEEITSLNDDGENEESSIIQDALLDDGEGTDSNDIQKDRNGPMKRPSPPTYVVALSPLEITVGGNGNETQHFNAGDVIFFEDTWLGIWDNISEDYDDNETTNKESLKSEEKVKGYTMRASSESREDMNVIMLTIPPALHRQWKHRHERQQKAERSNNNKKDMVHDPEVSNKSQKTTTTAPWWKLSSRIIQKQQITDELPKPCTLESDPAFAHPSVSVPTTLSQHFSQHFTNLLRRFHQPFHLSLSSSSSNDTYDVILPIFAQTAAATIGGATALAGVLHLLRTVNPTVAIGFGAACVIGFGTWGIVWLGEEMLDEWEMWRERRRLEKRMSESWDIQ